MGGSGSKPCGPKPAVETKLPYLMPSKANNKGNNTSYELPAIKYTGPNSKEAKEQRWTRQTPHEWVMGGETHRGWQKLRAVVAAGSLVGTGIAIYMWRHDLGHDNLIGNQPQSAALYHQGETSTTATAFLGEDGEEEDTMRPKKK